MKLFWTIVGAVIVAGAAAYAGNLGTFVAPAEVTSDPAPMGGSAAGWVVPLLAILVIAAVASSSSDNSTE